MVVAGVPILFDGEAIDGHGTRQNLQTGGACQRSADVARQRRDQIGTGEDGCYTKEARQFKLH